MHPEIMNAPWNHECILKSWMCILKSWMCILKSWMHPEIMNVHPEIMNSSWNHECILKLWIHPEIMNVHPEIINASWNHECIPKSWMHPAILREKFLSSIKELLNIWSACSEPKFLEFIKLFLFKKMFSGKENYNIL